MRRPCGGGRPIAYAWRWSVTSTSSPCPWSSVHAAGAALRWWQDKDARQDRGVRALLGFAAAAAAGLAACVPLVALSLTKAGTQVFWVPRPGLDLYAFGTLARNLFFSTSVAAMVILLGVLAWSAWRAAAFATAVAVLPVAAVWLLSQGPHSYFVGRYLLFTVAAWAILAGIGLSRLDARLAAVVVLVIAVFGASDQQVIRQQGAHNWPAYRSPTAAPTWITRAPPA